MTQKQTKAKAQQAIDVLLADQPSEFRAVVFQLCHQLDWADDEPSFLLAIATNQLEALVRQYPERISEAMARAAKELEADWQKLQAQLAVTALKSAQAAAQMTDTLIDAQRLIDQALERTEQLMQAERVAMIQAMAAERDEVRRLLDQEREAMLLRAQALTEQQKQVLETQTRCLLAEGVTRWKEQVVEQVDKLVKRVREKHFWETISLTLLVALAIAVIGWTAGWFLGNQHRANDWSLWQQQVAKQRTEVGWLLEKANRAECFYGIKTNSNPQCQ